jgi:uncharacterized membrane protein YdjX (TVP38/TMEM64 family)
MDAAISTSEAVEGNGVTKRSTLARIAPLFILAAALAAFFALGGPKYLSFETLLKSRASLDEFTRANLPFALAVYILFYAAAVAGSIPGALLLTITGGFMFGGWLGGSAAVLAATVGATCLFLIARFVFASGAQRRTGAWLDKMRAGFREDAASYMLFLRLVPIFPFWLVNLAPALLGVPLSTFMWTTLLGVIPGTFAYALAGAGLDSLVAAQKQAFDACVSAGGAACKFDLSPGNLVTKELIIAFAAIGIVALVPVAIKKMRPRRTASPSTSGIQE